MLNENEGHGEPVNSLLSNVVKIGDTITDFEKSLNEVDSYVHDPDIQFLKGMLAAMEEIQERMFRVVEEM